MRVRIDKVLPCHVHNANEGNYMVAKWKVRSLSMGTLERRVVERSVRDLNSILQCLEHRMQVLLG
jgi:hypothetical protein